MTAARLAFCPPPERIRFPASPGKSHPGRKHSCGAPHLTTPTQLSNDADAASDSLALERIVFFSDAVIAIAITLLAIGLTVPNVAGATDADFVALIANIAPHYVAFAFSFAVIAIYWLAHHRMFRFIARWDGGLLLLNLLFLFFVVQVPLLSALLGSYGYLSSATAVYAGGLCLMGLSSASLWIYSVRRGLVRDVASPGLVRFLTVRGLAAPVVFAISIPLAFVSPQLAQVSGSS